MPSTSTFYDQLMKYPLQERERIAEGAGLSLGYILKHTYVSGRDPKFHFHNAVALDRSSKGVLQFWDHTEGVVDWDFVLTRLKHARRLGVV